MSAAFAVGVIVGLIAGVITVTWDFASPSDTGDRWLDLADMEADILDDIRSLPEVPYGR